MFDTTCNYNKTHGSFNRRELRMLAQALGLPGERIEQRLNKLGVGETIATSDLLNLIDKGVFWNDFFRMFNPHSGLYNSLVFAKALKLVDAHLFSFDSLFKARLAFDLYEMNALRNDKDTVRLVLQTIQLCDYRISRLKLEQRLRHYHLNNFRILHLCEYFDLLLNCIPEEKPSTQSQKIVIDLVDPKPSDERKMDEMNRKFLRDERNWFFQEKFPTDKLVESSVWPAKVAHQAQVDEAKIRKEQLQRQISASASQLKLTRAGSACSSRHVSSSMLRRSRPTSSCSFRSFTPTRVHSSSTESTSTSTGSTTPEPQIQDPSTATETSLYLLELQTNAALVAAKYAVQYEDYMNELFPKGYEKPVIVNEPSVPRQRKRPQTPLHWSRRSVPR